MSPLPLLGTQGDLWTQSTTAPPDPAPGRLPHVTRNALGARPSGRSAQGNDARILQEIKAAGVLGRTRNELQQLTGLSIQTLSWAMGRLLASGACFRRLDRTIHDGKVRFVSRARCYVVYATLYRQTFAASEHPPYEEPVADTGEGEGAHG